MCPATYFGSRRLAGSRGLTLVESVLAIAIVSMMLVAALNTVGATLATQQRLDDRSTGFELAYDLMAEILQQDYEDADLAPGSFGLGADEVGDGSRALWEDVDDYDGWSASPPQEKNGTGFVGFAGWGRSVEVDWVDPDDLSQVRGSDTGVKRVVVSVTFDGDPVAELSAIKTNTWPGLGG